jgi:hypothetical protein
MPSWRRARPERAEHEAASRALRARFREEAEIVDVIVQLSPEAADAVQGDRATPPDLREAQEKLRSLGLSLEPLHPGADFPSLASWFRVSVEDATTAEDVADALRTSEGVESAYVEPPSAPPTRLPTDREEEGSAMDP